MKRGLTAIASCVFVLAGVGVILYAANQSLSLSAAKLKTTQDDAQEAAGAANVHGEQSDFMQPTVASHRVEATTLAAAAQDQLDDLLPPGLLQLEQHDEIPEDPDQALRQRVKTVAKTYQQYSRVDGQPEWASPS